MKELIVINKPNCATSEEIKKIRTNIKFSSVNEDIKVIMVTSSVPGEGKSFVSANLAASFAVNGEKTLLIDCDLRRGRQKKIFDMKTTHPVIFETAIICATVGIMCPIMSFIAAFLYYPYYIGFNIFTLLANWLKLVCINFPFAYFTQLFFIQPLVRTIFKLIFVKNTKDDNKNLKRNNHELVGIK